ncbi:MAG: protein kinase [Zetaproteobacteria bacterium]|nr:protein kinase [Zetaproteobacteria bacterium]
MMKNRWSKSYVLYGLCVVLGLQLGCRTRRSAQHDAAQRPQASAVKNYSDPLLLSQVTRVYRYEESAGLALAQHGFLKDFLRKNKAAEKNAPAANFENLADHQLTADQVVKGPREGKKHGKLFKGPGAKARAAAAEYDAFIRKRRVLEQQDVPPWQLVQEKLEATPARPLTDLSKIEYPAGEAAVLLTGSNQSALVKDILASPSQSVIRGTHELRLLRENPAEQSAVVQAFDLRPKLRLEVLKAKMQADETFVPDATFRSDALFSEKLAVTRGLGEANLRLEQGLQSKLTVEGKSYTVSVPKILGRGSAGEVYLVRVTPEGGGEPLQLAVKQPIPESLEAGKISEDLEEEMYRDIVFLDAMSRHPNATQFYGAYPIRDGHYNMVMEAVDGSWDGARRKASEDHTRMILGMADSLQAMHAGGFVHLDLKPENLFYKGDQTRLGDYGFAQKITPGEIPSVHYQGTYVPIDLVRLGDKDIAGDVTKIDTFAAGLSMLMLRYQGPYNLGSVMDACCSKRAKGRDWMVIDGEKLFKKLQPDLAHIPADEAELIRYMLHNNPDLRPSMQDVARILREIHKADGI